VNPEEMLALIKNRRSIRQWLSQPVEKAKMDMIIEAGLWAPCACNAQQVKVFVIQDATIIRQVAAYSCPWLHRDYPPVIIAVVYDCDAPNPLNFNFRMAHPWSRFIWQNSAATMMNMVLMAESLGLKTCWVSVQPKEISDYEARLRNLLKVNSRYVLTCFLFLGYSDMKIDLETYAHQGKSIKRNKEAFLLKTLE